jgi:hypothetical protein
MATDKEIAEFKARQLVQYAGQLDIARALLERVAGDSEPRPPTYVALLNVVDVMNSILEIMLRPGDIEPAIHDIAPLFLAQSRLERWVEHDRRRIAAQQR